MKGLSKVSETLQTFYFFFTTKQAPSNVWQRIKWSYKEAKSAKKIAASLKLEEPLREEQNEDELNANCSRHMRGGRALPINCWECNYEYRDEYIESENIDVDDE